MAWRKFLIKKGQCQSPHILLQVRNGTTPILLNQKKIQNWIHTIISIEISTPDFQTEKMFENVNIEYCTTQVVILQMMWSCGFFASCLLHESLIKTDTCNLSCIPLKIICEIEKFWILSLIETQLVIRLQMRKMDSCSLLKHINQQELTICGSQQQHPKIVVVMQQ